MSLSDSSRLECIVGQKSLLLLFSSSQCRLRCRRQRSLDHTAARVQPTTSNSRCQSASVISNSRYSKGPLDRGSLHKSSFRLPSFYVPSFYAKWAGDSYQIGGPSRLLCLYRTATRDAHRKRFGGADCEEVVLVVRPALDQLVVAAPNGRCR